MSFLGASSVLFMYCVYLTSMTLLLLCCSSLEHLPLQYVYAMVFAVEEINQSPTLLPGVKLGYHIRDSCALHPWAMQAALSLVSGDSTNCNPVVSLNDSKLDVEEDGKGTKCCFVCNKPKHFLFANENISRFDFTSSSGVPLIIGGASSKTAQMLSKVLEPLSIPLVSVFNLILLMLYYRIYIVHIKT